MTQFFERLRSVVERPAPFLTCYLPLQTRDDIRRSRTAVESSDLSHDEMAGLLRLIDDVEAGARIGVNTNAMAVVVQAADGATFVEYYPEAVTDPIVERADVPRLGALLEAEQRLRHHVLVVVSDGGVDVLTFPRHGAATMHRTDETDLDRIAHLVSETVKTTATKLVLIAGAAGPVDEILRQVRTDLPIDTVVEAIPTGVGDPDRIADETVRLVSNDRALHVVDTVRGWKFERAHGQAPGDLVASVSALRSGDARLLIVSDDGEDRRQVWIGAGGQDLAIDLEDAAMTLDATDLRPVRMVDGLVRSALLQRVPIQMVPLLPDSTLPGGVGVLRDAESTLSVG